MDIEDINNMGQTNTFCPFFYSRELRNTADIVFMPYNYLLTEKILNYEVFLNFSFFLYNYII